MIQDYINDLQKTISKLPIEIIDVIVKKLHQARINEQTIFVMGNGGSASTASHMVCDLVKNTKVRGIPNIRIMEPSSNIAVITAYSNDEGYEYIFNRHLESFIKPNDIVIGISTSGNSENVLNAIDYANKVGALTIGLTGFDGGKLKQLSTLNIHIDSYTIEHIEDIHLIISHIITIELCNIAIIALDRVEGM